jgi:hypothetical protein
MISNEGIQVNISYRKLLAARMIVTYLSNKSTLPFLTLAPEICRLLFLPTINNRVDYEKVDMSYLISRVHPTKLEPELFSSLFFFVYDEATSDKLSRLHFFLRYLTKESQLSLAEALTTVTKYHEPNN